MFKIGGIPFKKFISPKSWLSWLRGNIIGSDLKQEYMEQFMYRYTNPNCIQCVKEGKCIYCGCNTYKKMLDPKAECTNEKKGSELEVFWSPMVGSKQWKDWKNLTGLEFNQNNSRIIKNSSNGK